jgi:glutaredoxin
MLRIQRLKSVGCVPRSTWERAFLATTSAYTAPTGVNDEPDTGHLQVKLYQYSICPFCHRAKALLAYSKTPYEAVEVNPLTRQEIRWYVFGACKYIPVLTYWEHLMCSV